MIDAFPLKTAENHPIGRVVVKIRQRVRRFYDRDHRIQLIPFPLEKVYALARNLFYLKGGTVAKTGGELQSGYDGLVQQREKLALETARVSADLAKARSVVLSEVDAFARAQALSMRLSELAKERDSLALQIERAQAGKLGIG